MNKLLVKLTSLFIVTALSACVSQTYEEDNQTPVIETEASKNEKALTRIQLGLGYLKMGNMQQAKLNLEKAKRFSPNLVQVYTAFAHYYETVVEPELAIESYEKALSIASDNADTLNNYGVFLCRQGQFDEAEEKILQAIAVPSYILVAQSYENLSLCQLQADNFVKAELYLEKAIAHSPNRASAILQMMRLHYAKADYKTAQSYLYRYEKSARRFSADAIALAVKIYQKQGNRATAKNYGSMLVKMFPSSFEAKQYLLNGLYRIEEDKLAEQYAAKYHPKSKKRVVVLSPKKDKAKVAVSKNSDEPVKGALSVNGLQPIMANSVMPNVEQKAKQSEQQNGITVSETEQKDRKHKPEALQTEVADKPQANYDTTMVTLPIHVVKKGDSLFSISKHYNIVMNSLKKWNKLRKPYTLKVGDVVYLANPKSSKKEQ